MNQVTFGIILLKQDGTIILMNAVAKRLCRGDGLHVVNNRLRMTATLQADCADVLTRLPIPSSGWTATLVMREKRNPILIGLARVPSGEIPGAEFAILVQDLVQQLGSVDPLLTRLYGLSPAESRLARLVSTGSGIRAAAEAIGISAQTAKTQLKIVFTKLGVHRQSELAKLIASLGPVAFALEHAATRSRGAGPGKE